MVMGRIMIITYRTYHHEITGVHVTRKELAILHQIKNSTKQVLSLETENLTPILKQYQDLTV